MVRAVGVELTPAHVRILSIEHGGRKTKILQFHEAPIPPDPAMPWEERAAATLKEAFRIAKAPHGRIVAALDSGDAILREVSLPFKGDEQVRKTVRFEMESQIHNYTIEQLVVSYYKTGETDKGSLVLAAAVPKTVIAKRLKLFQDAGLDPLALDLDVCAVFNAMSHAGAIATDEAHLLVYGTSKFTKLVFIEERRPRSIRTIRFSLPGGSLAPPEDTMPDSALPIVIIPDGQDFSSLEPVLQTSLIDILAKEISRFLLANAASSSPAHILLAGEFEDPQAARMLDTATQIPVRTFNLLDGVEHPFGRESGVTSARMAAALGLALKGAGVDGLGMDFRQEEFQYTKKFEALKTTLLVTVELALVFLAAMALHLHFKKRDLHDASKSVLERQRTFYEGVTGEILTDAKAAFPKMKELWSQAQTDRGADLPLKTSAREAWRDLADAFHKFQQKHGDRMIGDGQMYLEIETLTIQQSTTPGNESLMLTLQGKIRNREFAGLLKNEIRAQTLFQNAEFVGAMPQIPESNLVQFTLKATQSGRGG
jgi:Tfp pilus assembly PilM family ATPase